MENKHIELMIRDVCARIPYGVKAYVNNYWCDEYIVETVTGVDIDEGDFLIANIPGGRNAFADMKPYLFPMSSMTAEQKREYILGDEQHNVDWLNKNHFDYRGLIEMGLALDATGKNIY